MGRVDSCTPGRLAVPSDLLPLQYPSVPLPGQPTTILFKPWQEWLFDASRDGFLVFVLTVFLLGFGFLFGGWVGKTPAVDEWFTEDYLVLPLDIPGEVARHGLNRALDQRDLPRVLALLPSAALGDPTMGPGDPAADVLTSIAFSHLAGEEKTIAIGLLLSLSQQTPTPVPALVDLAERTHPPPLYANRALRWIHLASDHPEAARAALEREARHPDATTEKMIFLQLLINEENYDKALEFVRASDFDAGIAHGLEYELLVRRGAWAELAVLIVKHEIMAWSRARHLMLAMVGLMVWFSFLMQQLAAPHLNQRDWLVAAFGVLLGAFSVVPTMLAVLYQDVALGMALDGQPWNDFLYFFLGVGLREEGAKWLCLLLLAPFIWNCSRLQQLVFSACVGLGFSMQENLQYFYNESSVVAYSRALSANFLHLSLTGLVGLAFFDLARRKLAGILHFLLVFFYATLLHAVYDLFLVNERLARMPFIVIACLSIMAVWFFTELRRERGPQLDFIAPRTLLLIGLATLFSCTLIAASFELGFLFALFTLSISTVGLGMAMVIFSILSNDVSLDDYMAGDDKPQQLT